MSEQPGRKFLLIMKLIPRSLTVIDNADVAPFPASSREAIFAAQDRVQRADAASDVEATVGSSKELIEAVAKAVIDALGESYGSDVRMTALAKRALAAVTASPLPLQGRAALQKLSGSLVGAAQAITELRNTDGTGHGRATRTNLDESHAEFVYASAVAWCRWILAAARRALENRISLGDALAAIGSQGFSRGQLRDYLGKLHLDDMGQPEQRQLGAAVARRWTVNHTFMPLMDVIEPLVAGRVVYPSAFCEGLVEGLVLDHNGFLLTTGDDIRRAVAIADILPGDRRHNVLRRLSARTSEARPSAAFSGSVRAAAVTALRSLALERRGQAAGEVLARIATQIARFPERGE